MSDDDEFGMGAGGPMIVEVKGRQQRSSPSPRRRTPRHDSEEYSEDEAWDSEEEEYEESRVETSRLSGRRSQRSPGKNGRTKIDMTPPDKKLKTAEKKATRFTENGKKEKAITELTKCLALNRIVYGAGHWKLARSHANLAEAYLDLKGYAVQAEYHTETAKSIMLNSVTSYTTDQEKADIYDVLFKIYFIQGRALATLKKYNEADQMLAKTDRVTQELSKLSCVTEDQLDDYEIKLSQATARYRSYVAMLLMMGTYNVTLQAPGVQNSQVRCLILSENRTGHDGKKYYMFSKPNFPEQLLLGLSTV